MIDILLATYNGEKYVRAQILSLLSQTYEDWCLIVHDDGSTDKTIDIIKEFQIIDSRINLIQDGIKCGGAGANFLHLLKNYSTSEYAVFCDQDDVWLENKLSELFQVMLLNSSNQYPVLIYCDGYSWSQSGKILFESISQNHAKNLSEFIMFNGGYQGCSIMMNRCLIEITNNYSGYVHHHDDLVSLVAHTFGKVFFLNKQLMLYRQHENAVTGDKSFVKKKLGGLLNNVGYLISNSHFKVKQDFYDEYKNDMSNGAKSVFNSYFKLCSSKNLFMRLWIVLITPLKFGGSKSRLISKVLIQRVFKNDNSIDTNI